MKPYTEHDAWWHGIGLSNTRALRARKWSETARRRDCGGRAGERDWSFPRSWRAGEWRQRVTILRPRTRGAGVRRGTTWRLLYSTSRSAPWGYCGPHRPEVLHSSFLLSRIILLIWLLTYPSNVLLSPPVGGCDCARCGCAAAGRRRGGRAAGPGRGRGPRAAPPAAPQSALKVSLGSRTHSTIFFKTRALHAISLYLVANVTLYTLTRGDSPGEP